jgi:hypothetical protein
MLAFHPENGGVAAFHTLFLVQARQVKTCLAFTPQCSHD